MTVTRDEVAVTLSGPTVPWPNRLLSLADWHALPTLGVYRRAELDEGVVVLAPSPEWRHQRVSSRLWRLLDDALPSTLAAFEAIDVELVESPATARQPDIVVVTTAALHRPRHGFDKADVRLAVEIVSQGSEGRDTVLKRHQYGSAGIPCYWVIDFKREPALTVCTGPQPSGGYAGAATYGHDDAVALTLSGVDEPVRFSVAGLLAD